MYDALRPGSIDPEVWDTLIEAWENGLSDREACLRAMRDSGIRIKESEIKKMLNENEDVAQLRDFLNADITSRARLNIVNEIRDGNASMSKWYLERKAPDEFSTKAAVQFEKAVVELSLDDKQIAMSEFMKQYEE